MVHDHVRTTDSGYKVCHVMILHTYVYQINIKNEKSHKMDYREMYMLHRLDIQRLSGKKTGM